MKFIGILGGMGPSATVDFIAKMVMLTPARVDQEHLPYFLVNLPQIPDRSAAVRGQGVDPFPALSRGIDVLNQAGASVVAIPCNSAHHWYEALSAHCRAPILHIGQASVLALKKAGSRCVAVLATRGALKSGFYQRELDQAGIAWVLPESVGAQLDIDECIRAVKAGDPARGGQCLGQALEKLAGQRVDAVLMACTEIPIAAQHTPTGMLTMVDSSLELARAIVDHALSNEFVPRP